MLFDIKKLFDENNNPKFVLVFSRAELFSLSKEGEWADMWANFFPEVRPPDSSNESNDRQTSLDISRLGFKDKQICQIYVKNKEDSNGKYYSLQSEYASSSEDSSSPAFVLTETLEAEIGENDFVLIPSVLNHFNDNIFLDIQWESKGKPIFQDAVQSLTTTLNSLNAFKNLDLKLKNYITQYLFSQNTTPVFFLKKYLSTLLSVLNTKCLIGNLETPFWVQFPDVIRKTNQIKITIDPSQVRAINIGLISEVELEKFNFLVKSNSEREKIEYEFASHSISLTEDLLKSKFPESQKDIQAFWDVYLDYVQNIKIPKNYDLNSNDLYAFLLGVYYQLFSLNSQNNIFEIIKKYGEKWFNLLENNNQENLKTAIFSDLLEIQELYQKVLIKRKKQQNLHAFSCFFRDGFYFIELEHGKTIPFKQKKEISHSKFDIASISWKFSKGVMAWDSALQELTFIPNDSSYIFAKKINLDIQWFFQILIANEQSLLSVDLKKLTNDNLLFYLNNNYYQEILSKKINTARPINFPELKLFLSILKKQDLADNIIQEIEKKLLEDFRANSCHPSMTSTFVQEILNKYNINPQNFFQNPDQNSSRKNVAFSLHDYLAYFTKPKIIIDSVPNSSNIGSKGFFAGIGKKNIKIDFNASVPDINIDSSVLTPFIKEEILGSNPVNNEKFDFEIKFTDAFLKISKEKLLLVKKEGSKTLNTHLFFQEIISFENLKKYQDNPKDLEEFFCKNYLCYFETKLFDQSLDAQLISVGSLEVIFFCKEMVLNILESSEDKEKLNLFLNAEPKEKKLFVWVELLNLLKKIYEKRRVDVKFYGSQEDQYLFKIISKIDHGINTFNALNLPEENKDTLFDLLLDRKTVFCFKMN